MVWSLGCWNPRPDPLSVAFGPFAPVVAKATTFNVGHRVQRLLSMMLPLETASVFPSVFSVGFSLAWIYLGLSMVASSVRPWASFPGGILIPSRMVAKCANLRCAQTVGGRQSIHSASKSPRWPFYRLENPLAVFRKCRELFPCALGWLMLISSRSLPPASANTTPPSRQAIGLALYC